MPFIRSSVFCFVWLFFLNCRLYHSLNSLLDARAKATCASKCSFITDYIPKLVADAICWVGFGDLPWQWSHWCSMWAGSVNATKYEFTSGGGSTKTELDFVKPLTSDALSWRSHNLFPGLILKHPPSASFCLSCCWSKLSWTDAAQMVEQVAL